MALVLFDLATILLIWLDIKNYERQITPLTIIGGVYFILININNLIITHIYSFFSVKDNVLLLLLLFFLVIFLVDLFFGYLYRKSPKVDSIYTTRFVSKHILLVLFLVGAFSYIAQFFRLYSMYGLDIKGKNSGILGHLSSFAFILGPVVLDLAIKEKNKIKIFLTIVLNIVVFVVSVLFGGKYVLFINFTYFLMYFVLKRDKEVTLKRLSKIFLPLICIAVGVFIILYFIIPVVTGNYKSTVGFAIGHMFEYLLGPIVANNYTFEHMGGGNSLFPFTVVINIIMALVGTGNYVSPINPFAFTVSETYTTNVAGLFGETSYNLGLFGTIVYIFVIFIIINFFFLQYRRNNNFYLSYCYSVAILVFLFFCNFYTVSGVILPLLLAIVIDIISVCKIGEYHI